MPCGCCGNGFCFGHLMYMFEKIAAFCAMSAIISCIVVTMLVSVGIGVGLGYNYCFVDLKTQKIADTQFKRNQHQSSDKLKASPLLSSSDLRSSSDEKETTTDSGATMKYHDPAASDPNAQVDSEMPNIPNIPSLNVSSDSNPSGSKTPGGASDNDDSKKGTDPSNFKSAGDNKNYNNDKQDRGSKGKGNRNDKNERYYGNKESNDYDNQRRPGSKGKGNYDDEDQQDRGNKGNNDYDNQRPGSKGKGNYDDEDQRHRGNKGNNDYDNQRRPGSKGNNDDDDQRHRGNKGKNDYDNQRRPGSKGKGNYDDEDQRDRDNKGKNDYDSQSRPGSKGKGNYDDEDQQHRGDKGNNDYDNERRPGSKGKGNSDNEQRDPGRKGNSNADFDDDLNLGDIRSGDSNDGLGDPPGSEQREDFSRGDDLDDRSYSPYGKRPPPDFPNRHSGERPESDPTLYQQEMGRNQETENFSVPNDHKSDHSNDQVNTNIFRDPKYLKDVDDDLKIESLPTFSRQNPYSQEQLLPNAPHSSNFPESFRRILPGQQQSDEGAKTQKNEGSKTAKRRKQFHKGVKAKFKNRSRLRPEEVADDETRRVNQKWRNATAKKKDVKITMTTFMPTIVIPLKKHANMSPLIKKILEQNKNVTLQFITL